MNPIEQVVEALRKHAERLDCPQYLCAALAELQRWEVVEGSAVRDDFGGWEYFHLTSDLYRPALLLVRKEESRG